MQEELIQKISELKKQRNAVILVHNYQKKEVQDIADFTGDSLELSRKAANTKADVIVFQFPTHWYSVPGILKLYIDTVMEHGWAYGSTGTALKGKAFIISTTGGAP